MTPPNVVLVIGSGKSLTPEYRELLRPLTRRHMTLVCNKTWVAFPWATSVALDNTKFYRFNKDDRSLLSDPLLLAQRTLAWERSSQTDGSLILLPPCYKYEAANPYYPESRGFFSAGNTGSFALHIAAKLLDFDGAIIMAGFDGGTVNDYWYGKDEYGPCQDFRRFTNDAPYFMYNGESKSFQLCNEIKTIQYFNCSPGSQISQPGLIQINDIQWVKTRLAIEPTWPVSRQKKYVRHILTPIMYR